MTNVKDNTNKHLNTKQIKNHYCSDAHGICARVFCY